jgi:hypothetical protein
MVSLVIPMVDNPPVSELLESMFLPSRELSLYMLLVLYLVTSRDVQRRRIVRSLVDS